jgi:dTDP-4-amino-4,6-dideoxygalactose transaminase
MVFTKPVKTVAAEGVRMQVPFLDIPSQNRSLRNELRTALDGVIDDAHFILGPAVERFEANFARYVGAKHCIGLNNGTSALHMALLACGIGVEDEVITTPATWISTSWAISYTGATPVFVDIDPVTYTLDPEAVRAAITPRTKAILPVHLYGQAADVPALATLAGQYGLALIEDCAQAHGCRLFGRHVGTFGEAGCFSFYPGKNLGAFGEGGCVVTDDAALAARIRCLRDHAQQGRHNHVALGFNTRMEGVQGAVLDVKLRHLDDWNASRGVLAALYRTLLADIPEIVLPKTPWPEAHVWHLFVVQCLERSRDEVRAALANGGVATGIHYPTPVPFQPAYEHLGYRRGDFPVAEDLMSRCLSLPMCPELSAGQVEHVARSLRAHLRSAQTTGV